MGPMLSLVWERKDGGPDMIWLAACSESKSSKGDGEVHTKWPSVWLLYVSSRFPGISRQWSHQYFISGDSCLGRLPPPAVRRVQHSRGVPPWISGETGSWEPIEERTLPELTSQSPLRSACFYLNVLLRHSHKRPLKYWENDVTKYLCSPLTLVQYCTVHYCEHQTTKPTTWKT